MTRKERLKEFHSLAYEVERLAYRYRGSTELDTLRTVAEAQERRHRAAGRRIVDKRYPSSVDDAVAYFVCQCTLEVLKAPTCWKDARVREDWLNGQVIREILTENEEARPQLEALQARWTQLGAEYSADIAGNR